MLLPLELTLCYVHKTLRPKTIAGAAHPRRKPIYNSRCTTENTDMQNATRGRHPMRTLQRTARTASHVSRIELHSHCRLLW